MRAEIVIEVIGETTSEIRVPVEDARPESIAAKLRETATVVENGLGRETVEAAA